MNRYLAYSDVPAGIPTVGSIWQHDATGEHGRVAMLVVDYLTAEIALGYVPIERAPEGGWRHLDGVARLPIVQRVRDFLGSMRQVE